MDPTNDILQPNTASTNGLVSSQQNGAVTSPITNEQGSERRHSWDESDPRSKVSAEEEAFLRSLGWTEAGDDEDGESLCHLLFVAIYGARRKSLLPALRCPVVFT